MVRFQSTFLPSRGYSIHHPLLLFCNEPYALWLKRIGADDRSFTVFLDWIESQNCKLYREFDRLYGDMEAA